MYPGFRSFFSSIKNDPFNTILNQGIYMFKVRLFIFFLQLEDGLNSKHACIREIFVLIFVLFTNIFCARTNNIGF